MGRVRLVLTVLACATLLVLAVPSGPSDAAAASLRRYPYLTDLVTTNVTINWATTTAVSAGSATYGVVGSESCTAHSVQATSTPITVGTAAEVQWKAQLSGLAPDTTYCYRIFGGSTDLLATDPSPQFGSQIAAGSNTPFSFVVLGDWGKVNAKGKNTNQAGVMAQIAASGARFAVTTGDTAYDTGTQLNYGDLVQTGKATSTIFGPAFWTVAGDSIPLFNAQGNHGMKDVALINWPQDRAVATSAGRYQMDTYCCENGTKSASYPSSWYAFDAGPARFYVLEAAWADSNLGQGSLYKNDHDTHWTASSAEYQWLANDLATHPRQLSFAFFHFPLYSDSVEDGGDTYLAGAGNLEALLGQYGVDIAFNGHAHIYERNARSSAGMPLDYVTGGGGATLVSLNTCGSYDQYALGWNAKATPHGRFCGAATRPTKLSQVYHFLLVTVNGTTVTVRPTNQLGQTFDVQTYSFS